MGEVRCGAAEPVGWRTMILTHHGIDSINGYVTYVDGPTFEGYKYPAVKIGDQIWLAENLDYKFCPVSNSFNNNTSATAFYYNCNEATYGKTGLHCGLLYNPNAVKYLDTNKSTLIQGWHVPSQNEVEQLISTIGGNHRGRLLKARNRSINTNWPLGWNGLDRYGLKLLPSGGKSIVDFVSLDRYINLLTITQYNLDGYLTSYYIGIDGVFHTEGTNLASAKSVRLIKD